MSTISVKTKDGYVLDLILEELNITEIKSFLEKYTGIKIGDADYDSQAVGITRYRDAFPGDCLRKQSRIFLKSAMRLFAYHYQLLLGGFVVLEANDEYKVRLIVPNEDGAIIMEVGRYFLDRVLGKNESAKLMNFEVEFITDIDTIIDRLTDLNSDDLSPDYIAEWVARDYIYRGRVELIDDILEPLDKLEIPLRERVEVILNSERFSKFSNEYFTLSEYDAYFEKKLMSYSKLLEVAVKQEEYELASKVRDIINEGKQGKRGKK